MSPSTSVGGHKPVFCYKFITMGAVRVSLTTGVLRYLITLVCFLISYLLAKYMASGSVYINGNTSWSNSPRMVISSKRVNKKSPAFQYINLSCIYSLGPWLENTYQITYAASECSTQPTHHCNLLRAFPVRMKLLWTPAFPRNVDYSSHTEQTCVNPFFCWSVNSVRGRASRKEAHL